MQHFLLLPLGFLLLIKGADWCIKAVVYFSKRFGISELLLGLTVLALGTSLPELVINLFASINNNQGMALGNIVGSNIANVWLVLGVTTLIAPLRIQTSTMKFELPFSIAITCLLMFMINDIWIFGSKLNQLNQIEGFVLLAWFVGFLFYLFISLKKEEVPPVKDHVPLKKPLKLLFMFMISLVMLFLGGELVFDSAKYIAKQFGLTETATGILVVAVGTSLPELVVSIMAAYHKKIDLAVGNVIGSNICNILLVLGISGAINPIIIPVTETKGIFIVLLAIISLLVFSLMERVRNHNHEIYLKQGHGMVFLCAYIVYYLHTIGLFT